MMTAVFHDLFVSFQRFNTMAAALGVMFVCRPPRSFWWLQYMTSCLFVGRQRHSDGCSVWRHVCLQTANVILMAAMYDVMFVSQTADVFLMVAMYDVVFVYRPLTSFWWLQCMTNTRQCDSSLLRNTDVTPVPVFFPTRVASCECYFLCLNPFTAPAWRFSGWKIQGRACRQYIFRSYNTSTFNAMRFDESLFTCQFEKRKRKGLKV